MIRRSILNINFANQRKKLDLMNLMNECERVVNVFIDILWGQQDSIPKFPSFKTKTWLSAAMQQTLSKQAGEIVKSQRKKKKKTKPVFKNQSFTLDSRMVKIEQDVNSFDIWITLSGLGSIGNKLKIVLPSKKHKHFNKFATWNLKKSIRLRQFNGNFFVDVFFEKEAPKIKSKGESLGLDVGYKKLVVDSNGKIYGQELEKVYEKIARKKQGSNAFLGALKERDDKTNQVVKSIDLSNVNKLVVEDLKGLKKGTKGRLRKQFVNKLQRWTYSNVLRRLSLLAEEQGVELVKVNPAYTSQRCSKCGVICKTNRKGELYKCTCGLEIDADVNASINILHLGAFGLQAKFPTASFCGNQDGLLKIIEGKK